MSLYYINANQSSERYVTADSIEGAITKYKMVCEDTIHTVELLTHNVL